MRAHRACHQARQPATRTRAVLHRSVQRLPGHAHRLRRLHDFAVRAAVHARRDGARPHNRRAATSLSQHVPALYTDHARGADHEQHGTAVGRDGSCDALHGAAGYALPDRGEPRGWLEVLHPVRRRHCAGTVRNHSAVFCRREGAGRGRRHGPSLDSSRCGQNAARAGSAGARVRVPARRIRHEGGPGALAQLAAGRARRGSHTDLRGALGAAAQCCNLCRHPLQGAGGRLAAVGVASAHADGVRTAVGRARRLLPVAAAGHQAAVRLLVDRAHGHHRLRLRDGRTGCELRIR